MKGTVTISRKRTITFLLILSLLCSSVLINPTLVQAATKINQEDLITSITNPSNGTISFYIKVPAGETVDYKVELIPHVRTGSIDTKSGSYTNSKNYQVSKKITVTTRYYSNKYTITASYDTGPTRNRTLYSDMDNATSTLKTTVYTNKFIWNDANITKWKNGQKVPIILTFAITGAIDIAITKGYISGSYATVLSITSFASDLYTAGEVTDTRTIATTPIKGWGYQYKLSPCTNGFTKYLIVYDASGKVHQTINLGTKSISTITPIAR